MTIQDYQARKFELASEWLAHFVRTTAPEKVNWRPEVPGAAPLRTAMEVAEECVRVNRYFAAVLRRDPDVKPLHEQPPIAYTSTEALCEDLIASGREVAALVRRLSDDDLENDLPLWRGPVNCARALDIPVRNMEYHMGQVNYIQLLAGDAEFHAPANWRS